MSKSFKDECGVFGVWNDEEAANLTYLGLFALQHRGQESAGIVTLSGRGEEGMHTSFKGLGLVDDVFNETRLKQLNGDVAIGHVRYSTTGSNLLANAQPLTAQLRRGGVAIAHNGNIVNANILRQQLISEGSIFQGSNDTEVLLHMLAKRSHLKFMDALKESVAKMEGAFSLLLLTHKKLIAIRDPLGFRPLVLGTRKNSKGQKSYILSSETCAFDLIDADFVREIEPGEMFWVDETGEHSVQLMESPKKAKCVFEHVYFSRPDSVVFSRSVYQTRKNLGRLLAQETPTSADMIIPVPDSGVAAALGYSEESKIPFDMGIIRNHYVGRTFIEPQQAIRSFGVKVKLNPQAAVLKGKRVIVVDDSLVRGTTSKKIIGLIRNAGATEVHFRVAAPPTTGPCFYGVDTPRKSELIASQKSVEEIREFIGADSLAYLSEESLLKAVEAKQDEFCTACFTGKYPTNLYDLRKD